MVTSVPVVDLGDDRRRVVAAIGAACADVGFFQVVRTGVDAAVIDRAWRATRAFFDLPVPDRLAALRRHPDDAYGYIPMEHEALDRSLDGTVSVGADLKETFNAGPVDLPARPITDPGEAWAFAPTPWPAALPELRDAWVPYFREMLALAARLMGIFAEALDLEPSYFDDLIDESPSALRALNYPHLDLRTAGLGDGERLRAGAHTDYGTLTLLRQDDAPGGLQVLDPRTRRWEPVPFVEGAFVVNLGDLMARWTNDRWRSTLHRVVLPPPDAEGSTRRQSMAFFHNADFHARVECLPTCVEPGGAPRYEPVVAGPHLMTKFHRAVAGYDQAGRAAPTL